MLSYRHNEGEHTRTIKEIRTMNNQQILETLAENECKLFYAFCADSENEALRKAHLAAKEALVTFAKEAGII